MSKSAIPTESEQLLDTGGGVVKALQHFEGEPFFILNSDSIWVEGYSSALPTLARLWDESRMDGLLLLAAMVSSMGYEGGGAISVSAADRPCRRVPDRAFRRSPFPACRSSIRACSTIRPQAPFPPMSMWDRAIAKERLYGARLDGVWMHVGSPQARDDAEAFLARLGRA